MPRGACNIDALYTTVCPDHDGKPDRPRDPLTLELLRIDGRRTREELRRNARTLRRCSIASCALTAARTFRGRSTRLLTLSLGGTRCGVRIRRLRCLLRLLLLLCLLFLRRLERDIIDARHRRSRLCGRLGGTLRRGCIIDYNIDWTLLRLRRHREKPHRCGHRYDAEMNPERCPPRQILFLHRNIQIFTPINIICLQ